MNFLDKIKYRFPKLAETLYSFAKKKKTSLWQDILLCVSVTLTSAFFEFEGFFLPAAVDFIRGLLVFLTVCCWLWCAFLNGFWKKYGFWFLTAAFWIIPAIIIAWEENAGIRNYSVYLDAAAQYSRLLTQISLNGFSRFLGTPHIYSLIALMSWCLLFFFAGSLLRKNLQSKLLKHLEN